MIQEGLKEYSQNGALLVEVINIYLNSNRVDDAMKYLDIAISQDPKNSSYYFAQGTLYDKLQKIDEATNSYLKAIEFKEDYTDRLGIRVDYINSSPVFKDMGKPYFNIFLDDRAGLSASYNILLTTLKELNLYEN